MQPGNTVCFKKNRRPFRTSTTFRHVGRFDWQLGMGVPGQWEWLGNDRDVFGVVEPLTSHDRDGVGQTTWWEGVEGRRVDLVCNWLSMLATDGRECHVPWAADSILHSCPIGRGHAENSREGPIRAHGGYVEWEVNILIAHSVLWLWLIRQACKRFHTGGMAGPPTSTPQDFHL